MGGLCGVNIPFSSRYSVQLTKKKVETNASCITVVTLIPSNSVLKSASAPVQLGPSISVLSAAGTLLAAAVHSCLTCLCCVVLCAHQKVGVFTL